MNRKQKLELTWIGKENHPKLEPQQMSDLFGRERSVIAKHLRNVFNEGELEETAVCAKFAHTATDGINLPGAALQPGWDIGDWRDIRYVLIY